jgi:hypothetical protein
MPRCPTALAVPVIAAALLVAVPGSAQNVRRDDLRQGVSEKTPAPELFLRAYEVFSHPRCANCHPRDDRPRWGERSERVHGMDVQRGVDQPPGNKDKPEGGYGRTGMACRACHQQKNGDLPGSAPGAPTDWRLAPLTMGWVGLSAVELCQQFSEVVRRDGSGDIDAVIHHIVKPDDKKKWVEAGKEWKTDPLVAWAWDPGRGRERPPGNLEQFVQILKWWKKAGAGCPSG